MALETAKILTAIALAGRCMGTVEETTMLIAIVVRAVGNAEVNVFFYNFFHTCWKMTLLYLEMYVTVHLSIKTLSHV